MNELKLNIVQNPGVVELNFDELERGLDAKLAEYTGAVFTEETKDIAKGEVASLRKLKKSFDDARKNVKKEWMKPYDDFEKQMKKLIEKIDGPITLIDSQIKDFEEKRRSEKKKKISALYEGIIGDMKDYLPLVKIYNPKWENATTTIKSIREDIEQLVRSSAQAVDTLQGMRSDAREEAISIYKKTLDLSQALAYINRYEQQRAEIMKREEERRKAEEERKRQAEVERIRTEERERLIREERIKKEEREKVERERAEREREQRSEQQENVQPFFREENELPFVQPSTVTAYYKVIATKEELEQVEVAFNSIGIVFERRSI